jgi:hypothetical protein
MRKFLIALLFLSGCASVEYQGAPPMIAPPYRAVLVAGDGSLPVWDNAVEAMQEILAPSLARGQTKRFSAAQPVIDQGKAQLATRQAVVAAISALRPTPGEGCLVYVTAHGARQQGIFLAASRQHLTPAILNRALESGCGDAPTIVLVSGCYSGIFAEAPMAKPNRVILTAASADRPSFGCGPGFQYTVYDRCLLEAARSAYDWRSLAQTTMTCVRRRETTDGFQASDPRYFEGANLPRQATR